MLLHILTPNLLLLLPPLLLLFLPLVLLALAITGVVRGAPMIVEGVREGAVVVLLEGGRWLIAGLALGCIAAGLFFRSSTFTTFGVVFLVEEIYETTMALSIVRWGKERRLT